MKSKAYRGTDVNRVDARQLTRGREGQALVVGIEVGKFRLAAVARWADGRFERPWRVANPEQVPDFVGLLAELATRRPVTVALEPSGTYGDPLRQALQDAQLAVQRVSPKAAHDYAEVFDGVPSQHDGSASEVEPRKISFKGAKQTLTAFAPKLEAAQPEQRAGLVEALLKAVAYHRVGNRPGRWEPRARKRRPKPTKRLNQPRHEAKLARNRAKWY
jgi:hypothetical protein